MQRKSTSMMQYHLRAIRNAMEPSLGNFDAWYLKYMGKVITVQRKQKSLSLF